MFWAFVALLIVAGAVFWLTRPAGEREGLKALALERMDSLRERTAEGLNSLLAGTPLAGMGDIFRKGPQPPPDAVLNPATPSGTLAGRQVEGTIAAPIDKGEPFPGRREAGAPPKEGGSVLASFSQSLKREPERPVLFSQEPLPPAREDSRVKPSHLSQLAQWLAARYRPGPSGGNLSVNIQALNNVGGVVMAPGMGGRASLLRYAFQPSMVEGLYRLYVDRFVADLDEAAGKRGFNARESRQFREALAGKAMLASQALEGLLSQKDLGGRLKAIDDLARKSVDINSSLAAAVAELDEAQKAKAGKQNISTLRMRVDGLAARYRRAVDEHAGAQRALVEEIGRKAGPTLDADGILFLASWVERRMADGESAQASLRACAAVLRDLARRLSGGAD